MSNNNMNNKEKPAHKLRDGALEVAIWRNEGEKGPWYSMTASRSYKQSDEWKQSDNFGQDDLLALAKLLDLAHTWILTQQQQARQQAA
jgi:hypothetical protein